MFNKDKKSVSGYNGLLPDILEESIPLFIPDELGPWAIRYLWIKKDQDDNF
jgi:hypothetical protein